jgi:protease-4
MRTLGRILVGILAAIGVVVVVLICSGVYFASRIENRAARMTPPDAFVLTVDLDRSYPESVDRTRFAALRFGSQVSMQDALLSLRRAKDDPRVKAVAATLNEQRFGLAQIQELRAALAEIRAAGKPTMVYAETIGEGTGALQSYYLAAAFDTIWVQPSGNVGVAGIGIEQPFLRKTLDRVGLKANVVQRKEYKSALETFTNESISPANREALTALLGGWYEQMVAGIAADRKLDAAAVKALIDKGPLLADEAKAGGLVDTLGYRDAFEAALKEKAGAIPHVPLRRYVDMAPWKGRAKPAKTIALVSAVGTISRGGGAESPFAGDDGVKSAVLAKAIRDAVANKDVAAIVLRVDSPGGSYVASDTIWREVVLAKEKKKPIVASMGNTAASGGYFIAMAADRIFADPATVTGSIGVITGKLVVAGLSQKLDVNWDRIAFGESAGMFSATSEFSPPQLARLNQAMDAVYADFTAKAAAGRGKPVAELERSARGRVWTGADALKAGLVDELGGLNAAIDDAKSRIGLQATDNVRLVRYPKPEDPVEAILKAVTDGETPTDIMTGVRAIAEFGRVAAPYMRALEGASATGPQLVIDPVEAE